MIAELGETQMQIGIDSFAAAYDDASLAVSASDRLRNLVEQIEFADQVGLDVFGIGEHHRRDYLDSAPAVILGAAVPRTQRIRLTSAVTVLSSADGCFRISPPSIFFRKAGRRWSSAAVRSLTLFRGSVSNLWATTHSLPRSSTCC